MADTKPADANTTVGQPPKDSSAAPKDTIPMKTLPQSSSTEADVAAADTTRPTTTSSNKTPGAAASTQPEASNSAVGDADDSIEPSTKGKEKDSVSSPVAKTQDDSMAIGPSVDDVQPVTNSPADGPVCNITLLLTTGARHPYKLDEKYLTKRNVNVPGLTEAGKKDPLHYQEWREEWDAKPASPSSIRLIHFGKLLDDKDQLKQAANVVHMTVRPADIVEEEEPKGGNKSTSGGGRNREGGGGCCVIL
ncbi:uncharacterized protein N0V96_006072 [Colletotrichum fioriniae]|uniref:uncharacterized protein n=1 Tax=Colletotrichum fioriniae TaxID=710243 RepID=UPI0032DB2CF6|nr:hypothetical protein N0V96_006072 [Colletotrichum fioriniae]